jgi:hypothetical protein
VSSVGQFFSRGRDSPDQTEPTRTVPICPTFESCASTPHHSDTPCIRQQARPEPSAREGRADNGSTIIKYGPKPGFLSGFPRASISAFARELLGILILGVLSKVVNFLKWFNVKKRLDNLERM